MYQQEIKFFWPLTEQVDLDLDYTPCIKFQEEKYANATSFPLLAGNGCVLAATSTGTTWASIAAVDQSFNIMPEGSVGYWAISSNTKLHRRERPCWLHQKMTKIFFGWEWNDK